MLGFWLGGAWVEIVIFSFLSIAEFASCKLEITFTIVLTDLLLSAYYFSGRENLRLLMRDPSCRDF